MGLWFSKEVLPWQRTFISVNRAKQLGNGLVRAADLLRELRELIDKEADVASHSFEVGDYTVLEANFGLAPGTGAAVAYLLTVVREILSTDAEVAGTDRLTRLDDFCSRLAGQ